VKSPFLVGYLLCVATLLLAASCGRNQTPPATIRIRWGHDPEMLDPMDLRTQPAIDAYNLLNISLLQTDASQQKLAPALADSLPSVRLLNDSITSIGYRIRSAATWDNGRPILARDVVFTLKLMFCPGLPNEVFRNQHHFIRAIQIAAHDPQRFIFLCRGRSIEYTNVTGDFFILSEADLDPQGQLQRYTLADFQRQLPRIATDSGVLAVAQRYRSHTMAHAAKPLPGCGAYELVKWDKDRQLTFRRKPHWWGDAIRPTPFVLQARPSQIQYAIIPDAAPATLALQRGDLDVYPQIPAREFARLQASPTARKNLQFYTTGSYDVVIAGFNTRRPALADALTRQALSQCFDAAGLLRATQLGKGERTIGLISPTDRLNYNDSLPFVPYSATGAAALLRRAGWQQGSADAMGWFRTNAQGLRQQLELTMRYRASDDLFATIALQFRAAAAGLNIPVHLLPTESGTFSKALQTGDFDLYLRVMRGNPFMFNFTSLLHTAGIGSGNAMGFSTTATDRLIEAIAEAESKSHRAQLLRRFQAVMQAEAPFVPLFFLPNRIVASRRLTGVHANSIKPGYSVMTLERLPAPASAQ
jgi:ABC-type transport system substrate-binding protein